MIPKVMEMEEMLRHALLYDFYGELLTEHQRKVYEDVVLNDYSLSEVADDLGISRQGVHDMVKRCNRLLDGYEEKLQLVQRFLSIRRSVEQIQVLAQGADPVVEQIRQISMEILKEL